MSVYHTTLCCDVSGVGAVIGILKRGVLLGRGVWYLEEGGMVL